MPFAIRSFIAIVVIGNAAIVAFTFAFALLYVHTIYGEGGGETNKLLIIEQTRQRECVCLCVLIKLDLRCACLCVCESI